MKPAVTPYWADTDFSLMPELFPEPASRHVAAFERFVRLADDIADDPLLTRAEKESRLARLSAFLDGEPLGDMPDVVARAAAALAATIAETGTSPEHARHVLQAFLRDVRGQDSRTWGDLMVYCQFAAAPVGRFLLELMGEEAPASARASDAMWSALRILRRLRDSRDPIAPSHRLCIPSQFLDDAKVTTFHMRGPSAKGQTRAVIDRVLDGVDRLLREARPLPRSLGSRSLRLHATIVLCRAGKLARRFRELDPLQVRVGLGPFDRWSCKWRGTLAAAFVRR